MLGDYSFLFPKIQVSELIMADLCLSIGAKISEYLVEPLLIRPLRPIFCFKRFVDDFEKEHKKLSQLHERVEDDVKVAKDNAREIYEDVDKWLEKVNDVMKYAPILQEKLKKNKSCFSIGWTCHYRLSKKACEVTESIKKLSIEAESFHEVGRPIDLHQHIELSSSEESIVLNSADSDLQQIMEALMKKDVNKVGLYGTRAAGETILAKQVSMEAKRRQMFERIVLVNVPTDQTADAVMSIQGIIADHVNLPIKHMASKEGIATLLRNRLTNGEKILIILDKVHKEFDLDTVGIPSSGCCKVLLTTHDLRICDCMQTHRNIQLGALYEDEGTGALYEDEGTDLFKIVVGIVDQLAMVDPTNKVLTNYVRTFLSIYLLLIFQPILAWVFVFIFCVMVYYSAIKKNVRVY